VKRIAAAALLLAAAIASGDAQVRRGFREEYAREPRLHNVPYDGRFTFARIKYATAPGGYWYQGMPSWSHGYPVSEDNLLRIMNEVTLLRGRTDGFNVLALDDPELFKYPIAMMWEPGFWSLSDSEAQHFREYLLKGGFAIFDDFEQDQWINYEEQMRRVLPDGRFVKLDATHPVFDTFFRMKTIEFPHPMFGYIPNYYGIFEDNDPAKRLMVIANHNNDVAEYWEWSGEGRFPVDMSNEAWKLGINYMLYGMTR